jgi:hypothetical protein
LLLSKVQEPNMKPKLELDLEPNMEPKWERAPGAASLCFPHTQAGSGSVPEKAQVLFWIIQLFGETTISETFFLCKYSFCVAKLNQIITSL